MYDLGVTDVDVAVALLAPGMILLIAVACIRQLFVIIKPRDHEQQQDDDDELADYRAGRFADTMLLPDTEKPVDPMCGNLGGSCNCTGYEWCRRSGRIGNS